jgi:hypothetical protein
LTIAVVAGFHIQRGCIGGPDNFECFSRVADFYKLITAFVPGPEGFDLIPDILSIILPFFLNHIGAPPDGNYGIFCGIAGKGAIIIVYQLLGMVGGSTVFGNPGKANFIRFRSGDTGEHY